MIPDQIRQIAEEYAEAEDVMSYANHDMNVFFVERFMKWLAERYCVVERSKVVEMYECYTQNIQASHKLGLTHAEDIAKGSCATMRDIFGSETFNKKEE